MTSDNSLAPARRTIPELSGADRKSLRAEAHHLDPVVAIGDAGLTPSVLAEADRALSAHGLIKIRVHGDDRQRRIAIMEQLCDGLGCAPIQMIGKLLVVWREKPETGTATGGNAGTARRRAPRQTKKAVGAGQKQPAARKKPAPRQAGAARAAGTGRPSEPAAKRSAAAGKPVSRARPATAGASPSRKSPGAKAGGAARAGLIARPARPSKRPPAAKPSAGGSRAATRSARPGSGTRVRRRVP